MYSLSHVWCRCTRSSLQLEPRIDQPTQARIFSRLFSTHSHYSEASIAFYCRGWMSTRPAPGCNKYEPLHNPCYAQLGNNCVRRVLSELNRGHPSALAVLAHWAVLLHRHDGVWWLHGLGFALVEKISAELGEEWAEVVRWPREAVGLI
ncbi:hypothetical protein BKA61DRAFT_41413 [Leptodontidium sp. MPI-SDFR-AT-0119]|nr:hypothetical protein BKA61DRAFT_41413 [Leptodontidium sp. MPI-SDFR-AT-0119]